MDRYGLKAVRPLAKNTMRRIIRGVDKFTIRSGKPFIGRFHVLGLYPRGQHRTTAAGTPEKQKTGQ